MPRKTCPMRILWNLEADKNEKEIMLIVVAKQCSALTVFVLNPATDAARKKYFDATNDFERKNSIFKTKV